MGWKKALNKQVAALSALEYLNRLPKNDLSAVFSISQRDKSHCGYLGDSLNKVARNRIVYMRVMALTIRDFFPSWPTHAAVRKCRLCDYWAESWLHLLCCCPALSDARRLLVRQLMLVNSIHSCRSASDCCFLITSSTQLCSLGKFVGITRQALADTTQKCQGGG